MSCLLGAHGRLDVMALGPKRSSSLLVEAAFGVLPLSARPSATRAIDRSSAALGHTPAPHGSPVSLDALEHNRVHVARRGIRRCERDVPSLACHRIVGKATKSFKVHEIVGVLREHPRQ